MDLMTIGAFAERTRLSPKALRLYDRLGLLPPARTDPVSGYRFYSEGQVAGARARRTAAARRDAAAAHRGHRGKRSAMIAMGR
jgi:DNA-binding transcriptional MerR regulator